MNLSQINKIYFIGIGGIGMSALARYFVLQGKTVAGYDRVESVITSQLTALGVNINYQDSVESLPADFYNCAKDDVLVIYTPAISSTNNQYQYFLSHEFTLLKRAEVLGLVSSQFSTIAIAGTHGKTTTSSMVGHVLISSNQPVAAFLGGITANYQSNYFSAPDPSLIVLEADEYDRSFLHLSPHIAVITSTDADHLDIYGDDQSVKESFQLFANRLNNEGILFIKKGLNIHSNTKIYTYGIDSSADVYAENIKVEEGIFMYDVYFQKKLLGRFDLSMGGRHNIENSLAAIGICHLLNVDLESIRKGISSFKGVKRRFEKIYESEKMVYIDDYAHHPEEINACINAVRELYPNKKVLGIFQPHLYSRTRDFALGFANSLNRLDGLLLMDIYPARELPIPGVTSDILYAHITIPKQKVAADQLILKVKESLPEYQVLLTIGAGDIDRLVQPIHELLIQQFSLN